jgi:pilus assembly protein HofN
MMIAVNLLDWRQRARRRRLTRWLWLSTTLLLSLHITLFFGWQMLTGDTRQWQRKLALWQQATEQARGLTLRYDEVQGQQHRLRKQVERRRERRRQLDRWLIFMSQLENHIPDAVWLSALTLQQQTLRIDGISQRAEATRHLRSRLRQPLLFQAWRPGAVKKNADGFYHFTLAADKAEGAGDEK